jgi:hypothetical protein
VLVYVKKVYFGCRFIFFNFLVELKILFNCLTHLFILSSFCKFQVLPHFMDPINPIFKSKFFIKVWRTFEFHLGFIHFFSCKNIILPQILLSLNRMNFIIIYKPW